MSSNENLFYLRDTRSDLGANAIFWRIAGVGYGPDLNMAETFSLEDAKGYYLRNNKQVPLSKAIVDSFSYKTVDSQTLDKVTTLSNFYDGEAYVVHVNHSYDGNNIGFIDEHGGVTFDLDSAATPSAEFLNNAERLGFLKDKTVYLLSELEALNQRCIRITDIDLLTMAIEAGVTL